MRLLGPRGAVARRRRGLPSQRDRVPGAPVALADDRGRLVADPAQHHLRAHPGAARASRAERGRLDFQLSEDQSALRAGIRSFCDGRVPIEALRELEKKGFDRALWRELAEMGVFSLRHAGVARAASGSACADAVLVFAELGRRLVPGPLVWTHLAADRIDGAAPARRWWAASMQLRPDAAIRCWSSISTQLDALVVLRARRRLPRRSEDARCARRSGRRSTRSRRSTTWPRCRRASASATRRRSRGCGSRAPRWSRRSCSGSPR